MTEIKKAGAPDSTPNSTAPKGQTPSNNFTTIGTKLTYALMFYDWGVLIAQCQKDSKAFSTGCGPHKKHIESDLQLDNWLRKKEGNYALLTGTGKGDHKLVVIDFDDLDTFEAWRAEVGDELTNTFTVKSARGFHVYYWSKDARSWSGEGFEIMGNNKAVMGPFSTHPSGAIYTPQNRPWLRKVETLGDFPLLSDTRPELSAPPITRPEHLGGGVVTKIKNTWSILEIIASSSELSTRIRLKSSDRGRGRWYTGFCPFHNDVHKRSFWVDTKRNLFGCYSCSVRGDVINFLARLEGWTIQQAIREMARGRGA